MRNLLRIFLIVNILIIGQLLAENKDECSDVWLESKLSTTIELNTKLNNSDIKIFVKEKVATLTGSVNSKIEMQLAEKLALSIQCIEGVINNLLVGKKIAPLQHHAPRSFWQMIEDLTITASIKGAYLTDDKVHGFNIDVDTENSIVTLHGIVKSKSELLDAIRIAESVNGVLQVISRLQLN